MSENIIPEGSTPIAVTPPAEGAPAPAPDAVPATEAAPAAVPEAPVLSQEAQQYNYERALEFASLRCKQWRGRCLQR